MKTRYQNEHLKKQVNENLIMLPVITALVILALFLCSLSIYKTYRDLYNDRTLVFDRTIGFSDENIYTLELTERPDKIYKYYYMVKTGDDVILVRNIEPQLKKFDKTGHAKIRGILKDVPLTPYTHANIEEKALKYITDNGYYSDDEKLRSRVAHIYLNCEKTGFFDRLSEAHPIGLSFGLTLLIAAAIWTNLSGGLLTMIKHFFPACGSVRYSKAFIDEQADHPESVWLGDDYGIYVTPEILIGTNKGMTAVGYGDIKEVYVKTLTRSESIPGSKRYNPLTGRRSYRYRDYETYRVIIRTKKNKRLVLCENRCVGDCPKLKKVIEERCGTGIWKEK